MSSTLGVNNIATTEYHPQTYGQEEHFNATLMSQLRHYVSEHETDRATYLLPSMYAYNVQLHRPIKVPLFTLVLTRLPSGPATLSPGRINLSTDDDMTSHIYA